VDRTIRLIAVAVLVPAALAAQGGPPPGGPPRGGMFVPDSLRNIQVLPRTMTPVEVVGFMRNVAGALGVRCLYCHVGQEGQPMSQWNFASDDKMEKQTARTMMEMVQVVNTRYLTQLDTRSMPPVDVACMTCHRGVTVPIPLADLLVRIDTMAGADSAARAYRALRQQYYGRAAYDFGEGTLIMASGRMARDRRFDDALAMARLNIEFFPQSGPSQTNLGDVLRMRGDTAGAVSAYRQALQLNPNDMGTRMRLRELGGQ